MTLILITVTKHGIINLSDSNIHYSDSDQIDERPKIWSIDSCMAAISIMGAYEVEGVMLDTWMPQFIAQQEALGLRCVGDFAFALQKRLEANKYNANARNGYVFHLAGFTPLKNHVHPAVWTVQDFEYHVDPKSHNYIQRSKDLPQTFLCREHCWHEISANPHLRKRVGTGLGLWQYCNATKGGRLALGIVIGDLWRMFNRIYENSLIDFRPPRTLEEQARLIELYVPIIDGLYATSNYSKPYIGGLRQTHLIPRPPHAKY